MSLYNKIIDRQKLLVAWDRVRKNKPAAGVDNITYEQFEMDKSEQLRKLHDNLENHTYSCFPIKEVTLYKGEKARKIALYCMQDKVVQQSLALELNKIYDSQFTSQTYAYRPNMSALDAIQKINDKIVTERYSYYVKLDIQDFFGSVEWRQLEQLLRFDIKEDDVIELIRVNACGLSLDQESGDLTEKRTGIYQGSGIAPILSNIYLRDFDRWLCNIPDTFFIRYSDDMIVLGRDQDGMLNILQEMKRRLENVSLKINEKKSSVGSISEGISFLGYSFNTEGKFVPAKAEDNLQERLEMMWLTSADLSIEEKLKKVLEIVGGWEQYFRDERTISSIFEYTALVHANTENEDILKELAEKRIEFKNIYRDIAGFLSEKWKNKGYSGLELFEYEQFYTVPVIYLPELVTENVYRKELIKCYRKLFVLENYDDAIELMQTYSDLTEYKNGEFWQEKSEYMRKMEDRTFDSLLLMERSGDKDVLFRAESLKKYIKLFVGREDLYVQEVLDYNKKRNTEDVLLPINESKIKELLLGKATYGTYIQRSNSTVRFMVFDIDVSKRVLLKINRNDDAFGTYLQKALDTTVILKKKLKGMGIQSYVEYSGYRGYHLWVFINEWIPVRYAVMLMDIVLAGLEDDPDVTIECFPNKQRIKAGKYGQRIKLPYGIHLKTGEHSFFVGEDGNPEYNVDHIMDIIASVSLSEIKRVIAQSTSQRDTEPKTEVDTDISFLEVIDTGVQEILLHCNLMRYLVQKSYKTGYLSHFERLSILYVFGHVGDEGKKFVHKVMSFTMNYQHNITERFILKMPEKPISCVKLRDQYKKQTAEFGCSCVFSRAKNCYPSPVLHAISTVDYKKGDVTLPASRYVPKTKEKEITDEINIHAKALELAKKMQEMKKQRRGLETSIRKLEDELNQIFDQSNVDTLEIEIGLLTRRKTETGYEWVIEI